MFVQLEEVFNAQCSGKSFLEQRVQPPESRSLVYTAGGLWGIVGEIGQKVASLVSCFHYSKEHLQPQTWSKYGGNMLELWGESVAAGAFDIEYTGEEEVYCEEE